MASPKMNVVALAVTVMMCVVSSAVASGTWFDRLYVVVFENTDYSVAIADPNFAKWAHKGKLLTNYHAVAHPSQPNYIATIAGSTLGITDDNVHNLPNKNLVDLLEAKPISWKSYNEDYTGVCNLAATIGSAVCPNQSVKTSKTALYARKHDPFISMIDVQNTTSRCAKIVSGAQLTTDKTNNAIPQFSYYGNQSTTQLLSLPPSLPPCYICVFQLNRFEGLWYAFLDNNLDVVLLMMRSIHYTIWDCILPDLVWHYN